MTTEVKVTRTRGGNMHPLNVAGFIIAHLTIHGEDYISSMHRAYKVVLDQLAFENKRRRPYHKARYHSFEMQVQLLAREGIVEFSGREEPSDSPQFAGWDNPPMLRYYRLARGAGKVPAPRATTNGHRRNGLPRGRTNGSRRNGLPA